VVVGVALLVAGLDAVVDVGLDVVVVTGGDVVVVVVVVSTDAVGSGGTPLDATPIGTASCGGGSTAFVTTVRTPNQDTPTATAVAQSQATVIAGARTPPSCRTDVVPCTTVANVLVVEDEPAVRTAVIRYLTEASHAVRSVGTALEALREVAQRCPDVVILDLGLPDLNGADALKMMRAVCDVPVIIATAQDDETEIVRLLNSGADDYLIKPFSGEHLNARLTALLRRTQRGTDQDVLLVAGLRIDLRRREASLDGKPLDLVRREFDLLAFLAARPGEVVSRRELLAQVWQQPYGEDQTIDVHLSWLRRKLGERAAAPRYLHTVRGVGVKLDPPPIPA
jgi:DNA-binding response OmpR family regulator